MWSQQKQSLENSDAGKLFIIVPIWARGVSISTHALCISACMDIHTPDLEEAVLQFPQGTNGSGLFAAALGAAAGV